MAAHRISAWIRRAQRPVVSHVAAESLEAFKESDETVFIAYLRADDEGSKSAFLKVAAKYRDEFTFGLVTDTAAFEAEKMAAPAVKCIKPLDGDTHDLPGLTDVESLEKFVGEASRPIIGELLPHSHQRFLDVSQVTRPLYSSHKTQLC